MIRLTWIHLVLRTSEPRRVSGAYQRIFTNAYLVSIDDVWTSFLPRLASTCPRHAAPRADDDSPSFRCTLYLRRRVIPRPNRHQTSQTFRLCANHTFIAVKKYARRPLRMRNWKYTTLAGYTWSQWCSQGGLGCLNLLLVIVFFIHSELHMCITVYTT